MDYAISNFTDIGIKDIQLKYIENIVEKSIYGIYCLALYLIRNIRNSRKNKNVCSPSPLPDLDHPMWGRRRNRQYLINTKMAEIDRELHRASSRMASTLSPPQGKLSVGTFTMVCCGHTACVVGAILYYMYITSNIY